ncbi:DUF2087 domain-containing protein [Paenibacillus phocaensis]|uniref:DUF2087 domain-containing protein n=1 Tax=Paenibacillus phocaensis TaxID=1776378 RepID=UPI0003A91F0B|nr:DUF2087 domain-containing protein [Paenibacillus phocaensis]
MMTISRTPLPENVLRNFFTETGTLKHLPAQLKKKLIVLEHLAAGLESGRSYTEPEINAYIRAFDEDYATIRREWIIHRFMSRELDIYTLNPPEQWKRWDELQ